MRKVDGCCGRTSNIVNQGVRELCNRANTARQVAVLKGRAQIGNSAAHIQAERDATSGKVPVHSRDRGAQQLAKLAAASCSRKDVIRNHWQRHVYMSDVRVATNAKVRTGCLKHEAAGMCRCGDVLYNIGKVEGQCITECIEMSRVIESYHTHSPRVVPLQSNMNILIWWAST